MDDIELSEEGGKLPVPLIEYGSKPDGKSDGSLRTGIDIGVIGLEGGDVEFKGLLISEVGKLICADQPDDSPVVDGEDGGDVEAGAN